MMSNETQETRQLILEAALPDIVFDGWSMDVIERAALQAGYSSAACHAAFEGGILDVLGCFAAYADRQMLERLNGVDADALPVRERIEAALMARFEVLADHKDVVKDSMKFWLNPFNKPRAGKIIWHSADAIWVWAGDVSTDYNRYTKRSLLSGILAASMLVWLNDHSEDLSKTRSFVRARIANVLTFGKLVSGVKGKIGGARGCC